MNRLQGIDSARWKLIPGLLKRFTNSGSGGVEIVPIPKKEKKHGLFSLLFLFYAEVYGRKL
jgi:hypothetical protein